MFDLDVKSIVTNTYFKGGKDDNFISGVWVGADLITDTLFLSCDFNGVKAEFKNCVFIDCTNPPIDNSCSYIQLAYDKRLTLQHKVNNKWS